MSCLLPKRSRSKSSTQLPDSPKDDSTKSGSRLEDKAETGTASTKSQSDLGTVPTTLDSEAIFDKFDLMEVSRLGMDEGWLVNPNRVSLIDEEFAHGGYGAIRKAKFDGKLIACKLPHHKDSETAKDHALMRTKCICATVLGNEMRLFRLLDHPNIVSWLGMTGFFFGEGVDRWPELGILLEWVDGGDLKEYVLQNMKSPEVLSPFVKSKLLLDVAQGLAYLHGHFDDEANRSIIMHRDMKPKNILVTGTDPPIAKIADFGLSMLMMQNCDVHVRAGTKLYMAPEVAEGKDYNIEADCFSFGCICFFVLTGSAPTAAVQKDLKELRLADGLDVVQAVAVNCLEVDAKQRPSSLDIVKSLHRKKALIAL